jgi:hypothetical protein
MLTEVSEEHSSKASSPMIVTLSGMVTEVREVQLLKALISIFFTLLPMLTEVSEEQSWKAARPILVTLLGITTEVSDLQRKNV